jgi:hypothetical protein
VRSPLSLKKLVYLDGQKAVLYRSRMNPSLGRNFEAMDPLEWLARLTDHIPEPGRHRTHFYAHYANRPRGERPGEREPPDTGEAEPPPRRRSSSTWSRLIAKVFQADPLVCRRCFGPLKVVAYITDALAIRRILSPDLTARETPPRSRRRPVPLDDEAERSSQPPDARHPAWVPGRVLTPEPTDPRLRAECADRRTASHAERRGWRGAKPPAPRSHHRRPPIQWSVGRCTSASAWPSDLVIPGHDPREGRTQGPPARADAPSALASGCRA